MDMLDNVAPEMPATESPISCHSEKTVRQKAIRVASGLLIAFVLVFLLYCMPILIDKPDEVCYKLANPQMKSE